MASRTALAIVGGTVGALALASLARERGEERRFGGYRGEGYRRGSRYGRGERFLAEEGYAGEYGGVAGERLAGGEPGTAAPSREGELREKASEIGGRVQHEAEEAKHRAGEFAERAKERAGEVTGRMKERMSHARERIPSVDDVRERASGQWEQRPLVLSLIALVIGAILGMFLPVSRRERKLLEPAKGKVREGVERLGSAVEEKIGAIEEQAQPTSFLESARSPAPAGEVP